MKTMAARISALRRPTLDEAIFFLLAVALPAVLPFVRRAAPVLLIAAAMLCVARIARRRTWRTGLRALQTWPVAIGSLFLAWAATTVLWTPAPARGALAVLGAALIFTSAALVLSSDPPRATQARLAAPAIAVSLAALIISLDHATGWRLLRLIHQHPDPYRYSMVLVSLVPLSFGLFRDRFMTGWLWKSTAGALLMGAIWISESETAKLAVLTGFASMAAAAVIPRGVSLIGLSLGFVAGACVLLLSPDVAQIFEWLWPGMAAGGHAAERIEIWRAFSKMADAGLPWGWGVESVAFAPLTSFYASAPEALRTGLQWMHPHSNIIQIATETGLPGLALAFAGVMALVIWAHADEAVRPARSGFTAAVMVVASISHGFWQMWWWSAVAAGMWMLNGAPRRTAAAGPDAATSETGGAPITRFEPGAGTKTPTIIAARRAARLLFTLVRTELVATYRRTYLGGAWALVNPLVSMTLYWVVFSTLMAGKIAGELGSASYAAFLCAGMVSWFLLADTTSRAKDALIAQADLAKKSAIPILFFPVASCLTGLFNFSLLAAFLLAAQALTDGSRLAETGAWLLVLIPGEFFFVSAISLSLALLNVYMRDIGAFYAAALQLWFWCTPVVYPLKSLPDWARPIVSLNPMTIFVQNFQRVIAFGEPPVLTELMLAMAGTSLFLLVALKASRILIADARENL